MTWRIEFVVSAYETTNRVHSNDKAQDHYALVEAGWDGLRRIEGQVLRIDIIDGKIWIQHDGTEHGIARELVALGVPRQAIVLGFTRPSNAL